MHGSVRLEVLVYPAAALLTTVLLAATVCRYGFGRRGRVSYGALTLSPLIANAAVFFLGGILWMGTRAFSLEAWQDVDGIEFLCLSAGAIALVCLFPALGVALYYEACHNAHRA
jgi:hypothetical protein